MQIIRTSFVRRARSKRFWVTRSVTMFPSLLLSWIQIFRSFISLPEAASRLQTLKEERLGPHMDHCAVMKSLCHFRLTQVTLMG